MMSKLFSSTISVQPLCNALATKTPRTALAFEVFLEKASSQWLPPPLSPSTSHIQQHQRSLLTLNFRPLRNLPNSNPAPLLPAKTSAPPTPSLSLLPEKTQPLQFFSLRLLANLSLCSLLSTF